MNGCANTSFLDEHFAREEAACRREMRIQAYAQGLMEKGGEYYPFNPENYQEALTEMSAENMAEIVKLANSPMSALFQTKINTLVKVYWLRIALVEADERIDQ